MRRILKAIKSGAVKLMGFFRRTPMEKQILLELRSPGLQKAIITAYGNRKKEPGFRSKEGEKLNEYVERMIMEALTKQHPKRWSEVLLAAKGNTYNCQEIAELADRIIREINRMAEEKK